MRSLLALAFTAVFAVAAAPQAASADTLQYSTTGYFNAVPGMSSVSSGGETMSFSGVALNSFDTPSAVSFGVFSPSFGAAGSSGAFDGDLFTIVISELSGGITTTQSITAAVTGSLRVSSAGAPSSSVLVDFGGKSASFTEANGNIATYTPFNLHVGTENATLQASVASNAPPATPLPKSVYATAGLLGLIGLRQLSRRVFVA